ncbi:MAB_1171c family putative transporter [Streptomyces hygroscopicus]|uniref:MAB_1171c family putative transporter n=1 Tax=Streptomyces hygroscopicus TaxID=1912 RepID=UPI00223F966F|nr:MAB_1171c family putative transporter [Streptomyces hygroscopicus]
MSLSFVYKLGCRAELLGALALWTVIFLRLPTARRSHQQKMLLIAAIGLAGSITVYLDPVSAALNHSFTFAQSCGLFMNAWGVLSSAFILDFVLAAMSRRHPWLVYGPMIVTVAVLVALNYTVDPHAGCVNSEAVPWYSPFWWLLVAAHLVGTIPCAVLCVRYGRQARDHRPLRTGLFLLAAGFTSSSMFWCVVLAFLLTRPAWLGALFPGNIGLTAWLMTAGVGLPLALTVHRTACDAKVMWHLHPLWRDLVEAVPHVVLERPRSRIRSLLGSPRTIHLRLYRQVIEIRDALLVLQDYVTPEKMEHACRHITAQALREEQVEPAFTACWLHAALEARAAAGTPRPNPLATAGTSDNGLRSETDFLLAVLRSRTLPAVRSFALPSTADPSTPDCTGQHAPATPATRTNR